ncbi:AI-2E family transporter [Eudoraea chungangensis]|uniref:AI-2E family transporter n=1 Tax=Eudoraea chungangensis TaxID=1481905 RepID=UPI0023EB77AE|nr:AI-2E family transporter [Eudoraea chungangensis]
MENNSPLFRITLRLIILGFIILGMVLGKSFLVPLAWALLIGLASIGIVQKLEDKTRWNRGLIVFVYILFILGGIFLIGLFFFKEVRRIFRNLPSINDRVSERIQELSDTLRLVGIDMPEQIDKNIVGNWVQTHSKTIFSFISELGLEIWAIVLILCFLFFILYYRDLIPSFFQKNITDETELKEMKERFRKSLKLIRSYIFGLMVLTLLSALTNYLVFLIFGLQFAVFFAVFLAILNLIPFVGNAIGLVVIMLFAILTKESSLVPLFIFIALFIVNFLQDNVFRPWLVGDQMKVNAFIVFLAIVVGGTIWGVSGMILFIPTVGVIKIILEGNPKFSPYAILFSEMGKNIDPVKKIEKPKEDGNKEQPL